MSGNHYNYIQIHLYLFIIVSSGSSQARLLNI